MRKAKTHAQWEAERKAKGICTKCNEPVCEKSTRFCETHRIAANRHAKKYQGKHKKACSYRTKISGHRARIRVMKMLGGLFCSWCDERDYRVLTIDHIDGHQKPKKQRKPRRNGLTVDDVNQPRHGGLRMTDIYKIERGEISTTKLRVLCCNCQARNEHRRGNRTVYPEVRQAVTEAGGFIPD